MFYEICEVNHSLTIKFALLYDRNAYIKNKAALMYTSIPNRTTKIQGVAL